MEEFKHGHMAIKLLVLGIVLILIRLYTSWDMWIVVGIIMILAAILKLVMPYKNRENRARKRR
jgi:uncharacterized membrane protein HdeD (DUF308 family)